MWDLSWQQNNFYELITSVLRDEKWKWDKSNNKDEFFGTLSGSSLDKFMIKKQPIKKEL